jgi:hypothetical protein
VERAGKVGIQTERFMLSEQAHVLQKFKGKGTLVPITVEASTL